nr:putative lipid desaturase ads3.2, chloroplastic [Quercus suber]
MALITSPPSNPKARRPGLAKLVPDVTSAALVDAAESKPEPEAAEFRRILLSDVVVKSQKRVFFGRKWNAYDLATASVILAMHCLCLFAPFQFHWRALLVAVALYVVTGLFGITLSFHRNLSHRSFKVPKWLEYFFAYCGVQALQGSPITWVSTHRYHHQFVDSERDPHSPTAGFWFSHIGCEGCMGLPHHLAYKFGLPCMGKATMENWWVALLSFGEGWHNNHHAFEYSARHGLEWWELDMTWYVVKLLQAIRLATDVKVPTEVQKKRMAI